MIKVKCNNCGKEIEVYPCHFKKNKRHFCKNNYKCYGEWQSKNIIGNKHPRYAKIKGQCDNCGKIIEIIPWELKRSEYHFCKNNHKCYWEWMSKFSNGKNSNNYIHGQSKKPYPLEFNNKLKEQIRKRDNYRCKYPGCKITQKKSLIEYNERLHPHHIDYNKNHADILRLISLCRNCNARVNANRDFWFSYFTYILEEYYKYKKWHRYYCDAINKKGDFVYE